MTSSTSISLTLRALLKTAAGRLGLGVRGKSVSGLTPAAKALFAAAAVARDRLVVVVPTDADVEQLVSDSRFFLAALEGVSDNDAAHAIVPFPSHEIDPYRGLSPHFDIDTVSARFDELGGQEHRLQRHLCGRRSSARGRGVAPGCPSPRRRDR